MNGKFIANYITHLGIFFYLSKHKCIPACNGCTHGNCAAPDLCECFDGYQWSSNETQCIPNCAADCQKCVAPNQCEVVNTSTTETVLNHSLGEESSSELDTSTR